MAEESERVTSGPEGNGAGVDPTAVALALSGASRERADSFFMNQEALIADQRHHLHEQLRQIHLDVWQKRPPNWGRLHLKWGEALYYAGKRDEAKAQFARATALDLTPSEKLELLKVDHA
jgi:hypothetical protein